MAWVIRVKMSTELEAPHEDEVIAEIDVFLSHGLGHALYLLQYPLRPAHLPYSGSSVLGASMRPESRQVRLELAIPCHGENYSRSRGEAYARDCDLNRTSTTAPPAYESGLMDKYSLTSDPQPAPSHRYVAGVLKDGELHLSPLHSIVQLRPDLAHLDRAASGRRLGQTRDSGTDGEATESEGEEPKPVTVKFACRDKGGNRARRTLWTERPAGHSSSDGSWVPVAFNPLSSQRSDKERTLLFSGEGPVSCDVSLGPGAYLDRLCPLHSQQESRAPSEPPAGAISLSRLKSLPLPRQVHDLLLSIHILTLGQLCDLLHCGRGQLPSYLEALQECAVLVQGCWVVSSHLLYPSPSHTTTLPHSVRDYLLYCFTQNRTIARKDVAVVTKVSHETVRRILDPLTTGNGWELKLPTDRDFIHKYPHIVQAQEDKWRGRFERLKVELGLPQDLTKTKSPGENVKKALGKKSRAS